MVQADEPVSESIEQVGQALLLVQDMSSAASAVSLVVDNMLDRVRAGLLSTDKGLSFLEFKYHSLLSYLIDLTYVVLRKCSGVPIKGDPAIDRLVEIRTVLEKMRPLEAKLKYRIDKLVKTINTADSADDPSSFKPRPENLVEEDEEESEDEESIQKEERDSGIYLPPKLAPMSFTEDETSKERERKRIERNRKRALESSVIRELRDEFSEAPTEISSGSGFQRMESKRDMERTEYEETYLTRLPVTKAEKRKSRVNNAQLGDRLTSFGDYDPSLDGPPEKKKKPKPKKGKVNRRRRFH